MAPKNSKRATRKSLVAEAAPVAQTTEVVERAVPAPVERLAAVLEGVSFDADGKAVLMALLDVPQPTMKENERWPWTPWNIGFCRKQFAKDLSRLAQTVANFQHVAATVEAHAAERAQRAQSSVPAQQTQQASVTQ